MKNGNKSKSGSVFMTLILIASLVMSLTAFTGDLMKNHIVLFCFGASLCSLMTIISIVSLKSLLSNTDENT